MAAAPEMYSLDRQHPKDRKDHEQYHERARD
jgi:hypothetical protein